MPKLTAFGRGSSSLDASASRIKDATIGPRARPRSARRPAIRRRSTRGASPPSNVGRWRLHGEDAGLRDGYWLLNTELAPTAIVTLPRPKQLEEAMYIGIGGLILLIILLIILF